MKPTVSVIIPVYNGAATIARAIESVLTQRFAGAAETVVVNDGSTDTTAETVDRFGAKVAIIRGPNRGPAAARNAGVRTSRGEYIAFLDADDAWLPEKLARTIPALEADTECSLVYSDAMPVDGAGRILSASYYKGPGNRTPSMDDVLSEICNILPSTIVIRRSKYDAAGGFCEEFGRKNPQCEDTWFFVRVREEGPFRYIPDPLVLYTVPLSFAERLRRRNIALARGTRLPAAEIARLLDNYELMARLAAERYGRQAHKLINAIRRAEAEFLAGIGLTAMAADDRAAARSVYRYAMRIPHGRIKTAIRLLFTMLPPGAARMIAAGLSARLARSLIGPAQA